MKTDLQQLQEFLDSTGVNYDKYPREECEGPYIGIRCAVDNDYTFSFYFFPSGKLNRNLLEHL